MKALLLLGLTNALIALMLYLAILAIKPRVKNPAILHWLWLIVLIKLLTPPIWTPQWRVLPAKHEVAASQSLDEKRRPGNATEDLASRRLFDNAAQSTATPIQKQASESGLDSAKHLQISAAPPAPPPTANAALTPPESPVASAPRWRSIFAIAQDNPWFGIFAIWVTGAGALWSLAIWRIVRLELGLRLATFAPKSVQAMADELAAAIRLRKAPKVLLAPGSLSPMLWAFCAPARIVVPSEFFQNLDEPARRSLLLHELAHYKRGDHYVRFLELAVIGLYWWLPVAWLVRREIRRAEELACDAEVIAQLPDERRAYAETLVHAASFVSTSTIPALASGIAAPGQLEERLRNIMRSTMDLRISNGTKIMVTLMALGVLPLAPMLVRAQRVVTTEPQETQETKATAENQKLDWLRGTGESLEIRIKGEIVDAEGKGVEGAKLVVQYLKDGRATDLKVSRNRHEFEVWIPLGAPEWFHLGFEGSSADGKKLISRRIMHREIRQMAIDGVKLELRAPDRVMEIKVVDQGRPVEGASVLVDTRQFLERLVATDKQGIARYPLFADDEPYEISAWTEDRRVGGYQFSRQPTRDTKAPQHVIELSPCRPQKIRFTQEDGNQPAPGIDFCLYVATPEPYFNYVGLIPASTMKTDAKGEATFEWFPDWAKHHFYVDRLDKEWVKVGKERIADDGVIEVRVKRSKLAQRQRISGQLSSFDGKHGGYLLEFRSFRGEEEDRMDVLYAITDAEGNFTISVLPGSSYYGHVDDNRYFSDIVDWTPYDPKTSTSSSPKFSVKEGVPIEVFVCEGPNKKPMVNQYVSFFNQHKTRGGSGSHQWFGMTGDDGIARGFTRSDQPLRVSVNQLDWRMEKVFQPKDGRFERIEMHRPIAGRLKVKGQLILPPELGSSLAGAEMFFGAMDGQSMDYDRVKVDAEGRFELETVSPLLGVYASTKDKKAAVVKIVESSAINGELLLQLAPTGEYQGQVLDEEAKPKVKYPVRASIGVAGDRTSETGSPTSFHAQAASAETDSEGNFTLAGIPFGVNTAIYGGPGSDNGRTPLERLVLEAGEKRPRQVSRLSSSAASSIAPKPIPLQERYTSALRDAKLGGWRMLVVIFNPTSDNEEFVNHHFYNYDENEDVSGFMHVYFRRKDANASPLANAFASEMKWPEHKEGAIFAIALDAEGKELGRIEIDPKHADASKASLKFLHEFAPQPDDANKKWSDAFALAAKTDRKVWVRVSQRFCEPCLVLNRWLDDQKELIEKDYVLLKVDNARDLGGPEVAARFWDRKSGMGVPFHAIFDASGSKIIDSAGPLGNIGAPSGYEGGKHLKKMLSSSRTRLTDEEIEKLVK